MRARDGPECPEIQMGLRTHGSNDYWIILKRKRNKKKGKDTTGLRYGGGQSLLQIKGSADRGRDRERQTERESEPWCRGAFEPRETTHQVHPASGYSLRHIYNKLSPPPHLGAVLSFPGPPLPQLLQFCCLVSASVHWPWLPFVMDLYIKEVLSWPSCFAGVFYPFGWKQIRMRLT